MVSPHAIFRGSLEYVFHAFDNQASLTAAAVTISRQIAERLGACPEGALENPPSPAPGSLTLLWSGEPSLLAAGGGRIPQKELSLALASCAGDW